MAKLTAKELEALTEQDVGIIIRDEGSLAGRVSLRKKGIAIPFYFQFRWERIYTRFSCGTWPNKSLTEIRKERNEARDLLAKGINPNENKRAGKVRLKAELAAQLAEADQQKSMELTLLDLAEEWLRDGVARKDGNAELRRKFAKDLYPAVGSKVISTVSEHDLRGLVRSVMARGATRQAISLFSDIVQMFGWAQKRQPWRTLLIDGNPADLVEIDKLVPSDYQEERTRTLSSTELQELHQRFQKMTTDYAALPAGEKYGGIRPLKPESQLALWICLGTLCRIGELLQAEWKNVDLENHTWFIPSGNVKGSRRKKQDHYVFLSPFALHFFQELKTMTGDTQWCFPNKQDDGHVDVKVVSKQVGDRQARFKNRKALSRRRHDDTLVLADGQNGDWTPHDLRRTGATMMQALGVSLDVIDRCQNHVLAGSRVRRHYLHHDYAEEKKRAWNLLGDRLGAVLSSTYEHPPTESMMSFPAYAATETWSPS
ncbi:tyrosine-type recombinase/integrase [Pseudomonas sp. p50]|uniref:tyrosine-type recombinase/integrase n=1 Tax=Pseudomonas sp. p50(2008) TaxID=2816832 RepID=UPI00188A1896|nr:site-specific integrase [Pseudomonas sp. p50(2008)]MBF4554641.1 tyrosine-type recombinase/integrase [Pseudomonas sp. p50(2008)]